MLCKTISVLCGHGVEYYLQSQISEVFTLPLICIDQGVSESSSLLFTKIIFKIHALGLFFLDAFLDHNLEYYQYL